MIDARTLKGFKDILPEVALKRNFIKETLRNVFREYGFEPLETPTIEYEEILLGKYGEEGDKLMYRFTDNGDRKVALRYDQTVPLARVIAQYKNDLPMPFKRYQMQNVFRAENTQKGRLREFLQCDIDTVGSTSPLSDAEIIAMAYKAYSALGFKDFEILVNDRATFKEVSKGTITAIDKIKKIGKDKVVEELVTRGEYDSSEIAHSVLVKIEQTTPTDHIKLVMDLTKDLGVPEGVVKFNPYLARGLDYYTSTIIEVEAREYTAGSLGGGGRYDDLIGMFLEQSIPAVGFAFGFDRIYEAMEELSLFPKTIVSTAILVAVFSPELAPEALHAATFLREQGFSVELWHDPFSKIDKQLKYANKRGIPYVVIIGPEEKEKGIVTLRELNSYSQGKLPLNEVVDAIPKSIR